jgi:hypothetical protein
VCFNPWFWSSDHWILILLHTFSKREPKIGGLQHWVLISLVSTWYMGFRVQISILHFVRQTSQLDNLSSGIPNLVVQNDRISNYRLSILVAMPCPYCMCTVFYVKQSVAKACFSVCWIIWLRFCKPEKKGHQDLGFVYEFSVPSQLHSSCAVYLKMTWQMVAIWRLYSQTLMLHLDKWENNEH